MNNPQKQKKRLERLSLKPLKFKEAVADLLKVKPPPKANPPKNKRQKKKSALDGGL